MFAAEAQRVAPHCWIQTPDRWFPVEAHLWTPSVHYLPKRWQRFIVPHFSFWRWLTHHSPDQRQFYIEHYPSEIRLLSVSDVRRFFPRAAIVRERFYGLSKSIIAIGSPAGTTVPDHSKEKPI